ncbi:hypothetical protein V5O48_015509 [Marasmius crinis-equi]|uniref:Enoyl reductase (ER) domain-containing protein n=1 Tax=Marasmius crinis-equi TaxID=585013 RepID=A0ABR3EUD5_9AGAR
MALETQKALVLQEEGASFTLEERNIPTPTAGEILVKIKAVALNPVDWKIQAFSILKFDYPAIVGTDIAGDVVQVGEGAGGFVVGDRVFFQGWFSPEYAGFQQFTRVPAELAAKIPASVTYSQAASVPLAGAAAAIGLFFTPGGAGLNPTLDKNVQFTGRPAVVIGGATSCGQYGTSATTPFITIPAIQLLKYSGFSPIITSASSHHTDLLKGFGATHIIDRKAVTIQDLAYEVKRITNEPIKIVFDAVSVPDTQEAGHSIVADGGDLVLLHPSAIKNPSQGKKTHYVLGNVHPEVNRSFGRLLYEKLPEFLEDGTIVPNNVEELPNGLAGIPDGLERLKTDQVSGKKLVALPHETF